MPPKHQTLQTTKMNFKCPSVLHFCICRDIYTFFELSEWLKSCFTQFGVNSHSLNFDKIRGTAPLTFEIPGKLLDDNMIPSHVKITIAMAP